MASKRKLNPLGNLKSIMEKMNEDTKAFIQSIIDGIEESNGEISKELNDKINILTESVKNIDMLKITDNQDNIIKLLENEIQDRIKLNELDNLIEKYFNENDARRKVEIDKLISDLSLKIDDINPSGSTSNPNSSNEDEKVDPNTLLLIENNNILDDISDYLYDIRTMLGSEYGHDFYDYDDDENNNNNYNTPSSTGSTSGTTSGTTSGSTSGGTSSNTNGKRKHKKINKKIGERKRTEEAVNSLKNTILKLYGVLVKGYEKWKSVNEQIFVTGRQIGFAGKQLSQYQAHALKNFDNLASKLGMTFEELFKFQEKYTKATGKAVQLNVEQVEYMATMAKMVGDVATDEMVKNMDEFGASTQTAMDNLALNMYRARSSGLDASKSSELFAKNIKMASKYNFREGINGVSKMTLLSQRLKFNMESIGSVMDKFQTIEGAISTSANLQMLGGSFANQFGNPLEAMNLSLLDGEGFTKKIIDTFSNKATFNKETGEAEMSPLDRMFLKEAAKQLGLSFDDAWNMATQTTRNSVIEKEMTNASSFSEMDKSYIMAKAQFNTDTKQHEFTYFDDKDGGKQKTIGVKELTPEIIKKLKEQEIPEKDIQGNVRGIHQLLREKLGKDFSESRSWNETVKGLSESMKLNIANILDGPLSLFKSTFLDFFAEGNRWLMYGLGAGLLTIGKNFIGTVFNNLFNLKGSGRFALWLKTPLANLDHSITKGFKWVGSKFSKKNITGVGKNIKNFFSKGGSLSKGYGFVKNKLGVAGRFLKNNKLISNLSKIPGIGKWAKWLTIGATAVGATTLFSSAANGNDVDIKNEENSSNELKELQKQTNLLKDISKNGNVKGNIATTSNSTVTNASVGITNTEGSILDSNNNDTLSTMTMLGTTKFARNIYENKGGKLATKIAGAKGKSFVSKGVSNLAKHGKGINLLSIGSYGADVINNVGKNNGWWKEGSHTDKLMDIGSTTLEGAGYGAMIGSIIPVVGTTIGGAIGGIAGAIKGVYDNYSKEISNFFNGSSSNETKNESTAISSNDKSVNNVSNSLGITDNQAVELVNNGATTVVKVYNNIQVPRTLTDSNNKAVANNKTINYENVKSYNTKYGNTTIADITPNNNNNISSIPVVGNPTYIKNTSENTTNNSNAYNGVNKTEINLNINGSLRLVGDKTTENIDLKKLLESTQFKAQLVDMVQQSLNERGHLGKGKDKNSLFSSMNGALDNQVTNSSNKNLLSV